MDEILKLVDQALKKRKLSAAKASELAVGHFGLIKNMKNGQVPSFTNMEKLFSVLGINLTYSLDDGLPSSLEKVPLLGYIAAGGDDYPDDTSVTYVPDNGSTDEATLPPGTFMRMRGHLFCLEVKGKSMLPVYDDGDRLYMYRDDPGRANLDNLIGHYCAVTLESGDAYIKRLRRPDSGILGEWNLESLNPVWPVMANQRLGDCLPVRHVTYRVKI
jgi:SOS-response transcriptional repressor LexA